MKNPMVIYFCFCIFLFGMVVSTLIEVLGFSETKNINDTEILYISKDVALFLIYFVLGLILFTMIMIVSQLELKQKNQKVNKE